MRSRPEDNYGDEMPEVMRGFTNKEIRKRFIRKVYALLSIELLILFAGCIIGAFVPQIRTFVYYYKWTTFGLMIGLFIGAMFPYYALVCYDSVRMSVPTNYIVFNIFVVMIAVGFMLITATMESYVVLCAIGTTMALVLFLTLISFCPCLDVTGWGIYLLAISFMVSIYGMIACMLYFFLGMKIFFLIYAGITAVLACIYIVFTTQLILGGRKYELHPDEYILGTIMLFTHIMTLLLSLLILFNH